MQKSRPYLFIQFNTTAITAIKMLQNQESWVAFALKPARPSSQPAIIGLLQSLFSIYHAHNFKYV